MARAHHHRGVAGTRIGARPVSGSGTGERERDAKQSLSGRGREMTKPRVQVWAAKLALAPLCRSPPRTSYSTTSRLSEQESLQTHLGSLIAVIGFSLH